MENQALDAVRLRHPILAWRVKAIRKGHNGGIFLRRK